MSENRWIIVRNWDKFQHRDATRNTELGVPIWTKVYTKLLFDDQYIDLSLTEKGALHLVWLQFSASDGQLSVNRVSSRGPLSVSHSLLESLNHAGFIGFSASKPSRLSASLEKSREEEKKEPPDPPSGKTPNPNGRQRRPSSEEVPTMIDAVTACQRFIEGRAWDESFDAQAMTEEFGRIERGRRVEGTLTRPDLDGLLEQWAATRQDRHDIPANLPPPRDPVKRTV